jgi:hypothetical protein
MRGLDALLEREWHCCHSPSFEFCQEQTIYLNGLMNDKGCIAQRFFLVFRCDDQLDLMTKNDSNKLQVNLDYDW